MGNKQIKKEDTHPKLTNITREQNKPQTILIHKIYNLHQKEYQIWKDSLIHLQQLNTQNLFVPIDHSFKIQGMCSNSGIATVSIHNQIKYLDAPYVLDNQIKIRKQQKNPYKQTEMWYLLYTLCENSEMFTNFKMRLGDIRPNNILMDQDGLIKLISTFSYPRQLSNFQKIIEKQICFIGKLIQLAPQEMQNLQKKNYFPSEVNLLADSYSIGMTILQVGTFLFSQNLYDFDNFKIDNKQKQNRINIIKQTYGYFMGKLVQSLLFNDNRVPAQGILSLLTPYQNQIKNLQVFIINKQDSKKSYQLFSKGRKDRIDPDIYFQQKQAQSKPIPKTIPNLHLQKNSIHINTANVQTKNTPMQKKVLQSRPPNHDNIKSNNIPDQTQRPFQQLNASIKNINAVTIANQNTFRNRDSQINPYPFQSYKNVSNREEQSQFNNRVNQPSYNQPSMPIANQQNFQVMKQYSKPIENRQGVYQGGNPQKYNQQSMHTNTRQINTRIQTNSNMPKNQPFTHNNQSSYYKSNLPSYIPQVNQTGFVSNVPIVTSNVRQIDQNYQSPYTSNFQTNNHINQPVTYTNQSKQQNAFYYPKPIHPQQVNMMRTISQPNPKQKKQIHIPATYQQVKSYIPKLPQSNMHYINYSKQQTVPKMQEIKMQKRMPQSQMNSYQNNLIKIQNQGYNPSPNYNQRQMHPLPYDNSKYNFQKQSTQGMHIKPSSFQQVRLKQDQMRKDMHYLQSQLQKKFKNQ